MKLVEPGVVPDTVRRATADAEKAARRGEVEKAFSLLGLAIDLSPADEVPTVLVAAQAVREALQGRGRRQVRPSASRGPKAGDLVETVVADEAVGPLGYPAPRFPTAPPKLAVPYSTPFTSAAPPPLVAAGVLAQLDEAVPGTRRTPQHRVKAPRAGGGMGFGQVVIAVVVTIAAGYWALGGKMSVDGVKAAAGGLVGKFGGAAGSVKSAGGGSVPLGEATDALNAGDPASAERLLENVTADSPDGARALVVRAKAEVRLGKTAAAARTLAAVVAGGQADADVAWEAGTVAAGLPEQDGLVADAYLAAFEAGAPKGRWELIAQAQERAGRPEKAERIRKLAGAGD